MTILTVDDSPNDRYMLRMILEAENHTVLEAGDGEEALARLEHEQVDAIISDILMPRMDGYRFCYEVHASERFSHLPFIFYSSLYTSPNDEKVSLDLGANKFLRKPSPAEEILKALLEASQARHSLHAPIEPARELNLMKEYNQQLVSKLEETNAELTARNEELLRSEQKLLLQSTALETAANAVVITDNKGIILWVNPAFTTLTGYAAEEVIGQTPRLLKSGKHDRDYYKNLWATILAGKTWRGNFTNRRKDGSLYHDEHTITPVRSKEGTVTHFIAIMNDVTERKRAEEAMLESEDRFRLLAENITDVFWIAPPDLQKIDYVSPGYERIWGRPAEDLYAHPHQWSDTIVPEDRDRVLGVFATLMENEPSVSVEYRITRPDGAIRWVHDRGFQVRDESGRLVRLTGIVTDITERKKVEISAMRLAAIVEFSEDAIIGKDLNSIITSWNKGAEKLFGFTADEMVGTSIMRLIPEDRLGEENHVLSKIRQGESVEHFVTKRKTKAGRLIDISVTASPIKDAAGKPIGVSKVARDISERMRSEQQLTLLNTCVSNLNDIILITEAEPIDEPGPRIVFVNEAFERLTGYALAETLGRSPRFLQGEKTDRHILAEIREALKQQRPIRRQVINYGKDGTEYWMDIDIVPIFDAKGKCTHFVAIQRNITEEKKSQESLTLFRTLVDRSNDAIEVIDAETGRFLDVNETACRRLGYSREEMLSLDIADISDVGESPLSIQDAVEETRKAGFRTIEARHRRKDGSTFPVEVNVQYIDLNRGYLISVVRDITERKEAEAQIAEQAAFLDKAPDAILVRDLEGKILFWNQGAERMYSWSREEVVGRNIGGLLYSNPKKFEECNSLTIRQGEWHGELQHLTKDGHEITIEARWTLIRDNEGHPKSILAINTDITEKKKIEAQFMRAQRMESIGTLAGGIAHDLNNILAPIMMSIDILKAISDSPEAKDILETIEISAKRGADIVRQVLSFARGLEGERIEIQPKHLLKDLEKIIKDTFPKDIQLQFAIPSDTWTILGDPTQVHQILLNLCVNARDAMPNGGRLTISIENCELDDQYAAMNIEAKPGRYINISVTDSGTGIPPELLDKIFEPFFTTKALNKGTGLGLSTVMAIVKSHDGIVNVYSEPGKGTTFKIYLPAMEISSEGQKTVPEQVSLPRGNGETILVVDDEASILTITGQTLQAFGYRILTATDGADAVGVYASHKNEIAVVLTDMMMPVMDGPAMIHALMRINPAIKIIAASGLNANGGVAKASGIGVKHFLMKPYTAGTLLKAIRTILDEP